MAFWSKAINFKDFYFERQGKFKTPAFEGALNL